MVYEPAAMSASSAILRGAHQADKPGVITLKSLQETAGQGFCYCAI